MLSAARRASTRRTTNSLCVGKRKSVCQCPQAYLFLHSPQSTCCRVNMQAGTKSALPADGVILLILILLRGHRLLQLDGCNACCSSAAALWENRIRCIPLYQFSLHPRPRLPVSSAEQTVLSKAGQTVGSIPVRLLYIDYNITQCTDISQ